MYILNFTSNFFFFSQRVKSCCLCLNVENIKLTRILFIFVFVFSLILDGISSMTTSLLQYIDLWDRFWPCQIFIFIFRPKTENHSLNSILTKIYEIWETGLHWRCIWYSGVGMTLSWNAVMYKFEGVVLRGESRSFFSQSTDDPKALLQ